jgi:hypothetical protein
VQEFDVAARDYEAIRVAGVKADALKVMKDPLIDARTKAARLNIVRHDASDAG